MYDAEEEPKFLMTGKCNEFMSYQPCDSEGEPAPGTELKEVGSLFISPSLLILIGYYAKFIHFSCLVKVLENINVAFCLSLV